MSEQLLTENILEEQFIDETRMNPFCVISKATYGEFEVHDIQTNNAWNKNPYGDEYVVVPDNMVQAIMETRGFCDIVLNDEETELVSFTALDIPEIPEPEPEPTAEEMLNAMLGVTSYE